MPGFGLDGPWRDNPAFAFVIEDAAGLTWMTGLPRPEPGLAVLRRRLERRHARAVRAAPRAGAPPADRRGRRSSRRRWSTPRSTSPPSRSSSTRPTARCSSGTATGARPPRRRTSTSTADTDDDGRARRVGGDRRRRPTTSGWPSATRSASPTWAMDPALATAAGRRAQHDAIDAHLASVVRRAERRRDRRLPVGGRRAGGQGDAAPRAADAAPAAVPRLLRGRRPPGHRHRPAQHAADAVLPRARALPPPPRTAARRAHRRGAARRSASPTTSWPTLEADGVIGRVPDDRQVAPG